MMSTFTDQMRQLAASLQITARHISKQHVDDHVLAGLLHRAGAVMREAGRSIDDLFTQAAPDLIARLDALITDDNTKN
jgi:HD-like signal output (HDOD) protein